MFGPLNFSAESLQQEVERLTGKLKAAVENLQDIGPATVGCTPKQEVWRDGKVVEAGFCTATRVMPRNAAPAACRC